MLQPGLGSSGREGRGPAAAGRQLSLGARVQLTPPRAARTTAPPPPLTAGPRRGGGGRPLPPPPPLPLPAGARRRRYGRFRDGPRGAAAAPWR